MFVSQVGILTGMNNESQQSDVADMMARYMLLTLTRDNDVGTHTFRTHVREFNGLVQLVHGLLIYCVVANCVHMVTSIVSVTGPMQTRNRYVLSFVHPLQLWGSCPVHPV